MRTVLRVLAAAALSVPFTVAATAAGRGAAPTCAEAAGVHHAALVVEHGNGATVTACVAFTEDSITGEQLLAMSRVQYATVDYPGLGQAVCQIDGEPPTYPPSCWTASSPYWAMDVSRGGGGWTQSGLGISTQTFRDGDAEGFRYEAQGSSATPPSPAGVCPPPVATTPAPPPTAAPRPASVAAPTAPPAGTGTAAAAPASSQAAPQSPTLPSASLSPQAISPARVASPTPARSGGLNAGLIAAVVVLCSLLGLLGARVAGRRTPPANTP